MVIASTKDFFLDDFSKTLFPLRTNHFLVEHGSALIGEYVDRCLLPSETAYSFLPQRRVYAAKPQLHLRRTVKLDPVAEYYLYDLAYRNRALFRKPHTKDRAHFGYRFQDGEPVTPTAAYRAFKSAIAQYRAEYKYFLSLDVASYFNSIYHHDLVAWLADTGGTADDQNGFGQLLREINSGRSVDCLPQGLYPAKMVGNDFLRFIDNYGGLRSAKLLRFMDDIYIFSDDQRNITYDFVLIQRLLGEKGLSINPSKTNREEPGPTRIDEGLDDIKKRLLKRRRVLFTVGYEGDEETKEYKFRKPLSDEDLAYVSELLSHESLEEEDAELILAVMREHTTKVEKRLPYIVSSFPNLAKNISSFCGHVDDKEFVAATVIGYVRSTDHIQEYQLFWFGVMLEEYLIGTSQGANLVTALYNHQSATPITRAKILEIPDVRFGLHEMREELLGSGQSDWLAWAAAVGHRALKPISRNHKLTYFGKSSPMNQLIYRVVSGYAGP